MKSMNPPPRKESCFLEALSQYLRRQADENHDFCDQNSLYTGKVTYTLKTFQPRTGSPVCPDTAFGECRVLKFSSLHTPPPRRKESYFKVNMIWCPSEIL
jgi:hypothetical protein